MFREVLSFYVWVLRAVFRCDYLHHDNSFLEMGMEILYNLCWVLKEFLIQSWSFYICAKNGKWIQSAKVLGKVIYW